MKIRAEYLADKLPDFVLHPAEDSGDEWYWECLECGLELSKWSLGMSLKKIVRS